MSDALPPIEELLSEFDSGKIPRSQTWHTLITGLYFNFDSVNEIEGWYKTVQELTSFNQDLANKIQQNHDQIDIWYGEVDTWQQQVASHTQQAAASASAAQASETAAASSASTASTAADTATQQASAAEASATKARASETASASSASQAESSATSAGSSATNALNSANKAKASETAAQEAASTAQTSEHNSEESASQAKASETAAASSASTATQQADRSESEADRSEAAAEKINREGIPIGAIMPYYGSSAPMGWLGLTKGATISKADYPALWDLLQRNVRPPLTSFDVNTSDPAFSTTGLYHSNTNKYAIITGQPDNVYRTERIKASITNPDINYICVFVPVSGSTPFPNTLVNVTLYHSLTDIPLPNDECFLPDAANNFIKGYEPSGTREMGTFEQDAIRNISGWLKGQGKDGYSFNQALIGGGVFTSVEIGTASSPSNQTLHEGTKLELNIANSVPTGPENVPKNLNCLWIIKAYDAVNDPEQLQAKAVIDQVNGNSSDILAINSELDRIDYALLDFGTVNIASRYFQHNPFGSTKCMCEVEIFENSLGWFCPEWFDIQTSVPYFRGTRVSSYNSSIVVTTAKTSLTASDAGTPVDAPLLTTAPCRVHVWRVKG